MKQHSSYNSTENLKVTYFLGAGASYNSLPIWNEQGDSMVQVSNQIIDKLKSEKLLKSPRTKSLYKNETLLLFAEKLSNYGCLAVEYGSIDIYARRLHLLDDFEQLNELKYCLSVYFDLWEKFLFRGNILGRKTYFDQIDKRYLSLLSVILEKNGLKPKLNNLVSFITWNYDLQLEMAYNSFLPTSKNSLKQINSGIRFMNDEVEDNPLDIIHLNGFRGIFKNENKKYAIVEEKYNDSIEEYLIGLLDNYSQFKRPSPDYRDCIKYAWEANSKSIENARAVMRETDILIIVGYSFPSFNRRIDSELIKEFESTSYHKIIYQDPYANEDIVNSIFSNPDDVQFEKINSKQFYIPHEFLFSTKGKGISFDK